MRGRISRSGTLGKYRYAHAVANQSGLTRDWKVALLKDRGDETPDFLETVMVNAGYAFLIFEDEEEAFDWLGR